MIDVENAPGFSFDARRWTPREKVVGAATAVLLIAVFMPWFGVSILHTHVGSLTGLQDSLLWLVIVLVVAIGVLLALRAGLGRVPFAAPPGDRQLLAGAAWLNLLLVVAAFLLKPGWTGQPVPPGSVSVSWDVGAYLGLAAAVVAAAASGLPRRSALPPLPRPRRLRPRRPPQPGQPEGAPGRDTPSA